MNQPTVEEVVNKLGEPTRGLVTRAFAWLDKKDKHFQNKSQVDRWQFIERLLEQHSTEQETS